MPYDTISPKRFAETVNGCLSSGAEVLIMGDNDKLLKTYQPHKILSVKYQYWEYDEPSIPLELYRNILKNVEVESTKRGKYEIWKNLQKLKSRWSGMTGVISGDSLFFDGKISKETLEVRCSGNKVFSYCREMCGTNEDGTPIVFGLMPCFCEERYDKYDISVDYICGFRGAKICKLR